MFYCEKLSQDRMVSYDQLFSHECVLDEKFTVFYCEKLSQDRMNSYDRHECVTGQNE